MSRRFVAVAITVENDVITEPPFMRPYIDDMAHRETMPETEHFFPALRRVGRDTDYCHLEKLHNLEALPPAGITGSCFPHKIKSASAGWTRAVAIMDE